MNFNSWFTHLLYACKSCAERDVLRNQKEALRIEWNKVFAEPETPTGEKT